MSTSVPTSTVFSGPSLARPAALLGRSTASVRTRYRRQTAVLMVATTVAGLWLGVSAPAVSPVATAPPVAATATAAAGTATADAGQVGTTTFDRGGDTPHRHDEQQGHHR